ncbi:hypothetical protein ACFVQ0_18460 [Streptomyces sp. NPDC057900]
MFRSRAAWAVIGTTAIPLAGVPAAHAAATGSFRAATSDTVKA